MKRKMTFLEMSQKVAQAIEMFSDPETSLDLSDIEDLFTVEQVKEAAVDYNRDMPKMTAAANKIIAGVTAVVGITTLLKAKLAGDSTAQQAIYYLLPICPGEAIIRFAETRNLW